MLVGVRERLIRNRTQLANVIRGLAMEFGIVAAKGMCRMNCCEAYWWFRSRHASRWLIELLQRKKPKLVSGALTNTIARIALKSTSPRSPLRRMTGESRCCDVADLQRPDRHYRPDRFLVGVRRAWAGLTAGAVPN
jgi:hypothetical protein